MCWLGNYILNDILYGLVDYYSVWLFNVRLNLFLFWFVIIIVLVSCIVIISSIDYLSYLFDSILLLLYISVFQFIMILFVISNDLMTSLFMWDWLGIISYLLINLFSSRSNCGIKAVVYNKVGDCFFLFIISLSFTLISFVNYYPFLTFNLYSFIFSIFNFTNFYFYFILSFIIVFFSKSAQLPFSSWLLNAMSAPTPISALLHSSTMVIAGVYLSSSLYSCFYKTFLTSYLFYFDNGLFLILLFVYFVGSLICTLLWSLFRAISLSDIKSIIAFSTVNQLSFMFISLLIGFPLLFIFHCLVHALFKSLLFLVAGSLIHVQFNSQSIFKLCYFNLSFELAAKNNLSRDLWPHLRQQAPSALAWRGATAASHLSSSGSLNYSCSNSLIRSLFIIGSCALILSFSKEGIIHSSSFICNSSFISQCLILGGFFTCCYLFRIYFFVFSFNFLWIKSFSEMAFGRAILDLPRGRALRYHLFSPFGLLRFNASSFYLVCFSFFAFNSFLFDIMFSYLFSCSFFYSIFNFHDSFFFIDLIPFSLLFPYLIFLFFLVVASWA